MTTIRASNELAWRYVLDEEHSSLRRGRRHISVLLLLLFVDEFAYCVKPVNVQKTGSAHD